MEAPKVVGAGAHEVGQEAESGVCSAQREGKEETCCGLRLLSGTGSDDGVRLLLEVP